MSQSTHVHSSIDGGVLPTSSLIAATGVIGTGAASTVVDITTTYRIPFWSDTNTLSSDATLLWGGYFNSPALRVPNLILSGALTIQFTGATAVFSATVGNVFFRAPASKGINFADNGPTTVNIGQGGGTIAIGTNSGNTPAAGVIGLYKGTATNNAVFEIFRADAQVSTASTGSANGFGGAFDFYLETATSLTTQQAGRISASWVDATNATRKADLVLSAYDTAAREGIRVRADGTRSLVGIDTAAPTARLHLPAGGTAANTAPLKFTTQAAALTSVEQGTMELVGNSLQFTQLAKRCGVVMSQSTMTASFTLVSSAAESATIITAEHGANYLEVGKMEEIRLYGTLQKDVGTPTNTLTIRVKYAGATIHTIVSSNAVVAANTQVEIIIVTTLRTTGATGTMQINSIVRIDGDVITPAAPSLVTVNTTTAEDTTITAQFTNSSATNNLVIHQGRVLCIEPNR